MAKSKYQSARYRKNARSLNGPEEVSKKQSSGGARLGLFLGGSVGGFIAGIFFPRYAFPVGMVTSIAGNLIKPENGRSGVMGLGTGMAIAGVAIRAASGVAAMSEAKDVLLAKLTGKSLDAAPAAVLPTSIPITESQTTLSADDLEIAGLNNIRYFQFQQSQPLAPAEPVFSGMDAVIRDVENHSRQMVEEAMRRQAVKTSSVVSSNDDGYEDDDEKQY